MNNMVKKYKTKNGQILLITLLVLTILSIITVSLVILVNKDIKQVVSNDKYEQSYNASESQLSRFLDKYATYKIPAITALITDPVLGVGCIPGPQFVDKTEVTCTFNNDPNLTSFKTDTTSVVIDDLKKLDAYPINKDSAYELNLNNGVSGYNGRLDISWDKQPSAIDFALIYSDSTGKERMIRDVYDFNGIFFSNLGGTYSSNNLIHPFDFYNNINNSALNTSFTISKIKGLNGVPKTLRITLRMKNLNDSTQVTVIPSDFVTFPIQMREFTSTSFDSKDANPPVAKVQTKIPLYPQLDSFFDYSLISNIALTVGTGSTPPQPP